MTRGANRSLDPQDTLVAVRSWPSERARSWTLTAMRVAGTDPAVRAVVGSGSAVRDVEQSDDLDLVLVYATRRPQPAEGPDRCRPAAVRRDRRPYVNSRPAMNTCHGQYGTAMRCSSVRRGWTRLAEAWIDRLLLPSADDARERARKVKRLYDDVVAIGDDDAAAELRVSMLTNLARAALSSAGVFPKSRPELVEQLRRINDQTLADRLAYALAHRYG